MRDDIVVGRDPLVGIHPKAAGFKYARGAHPLAWKIAPARLRHTVSTVWKQWSGCSIL